MILVVLWLSAGCRPTAPPSSPPSSSSSAFAAEAPPARIVTLAPDADEILCLLGTADRIVGVSRFTSFPDELADRPRVGGLYDPDLERILALRPDLIILRGRNAQVEQLCAQHAIRLYHDPTESLADLFKTVEDIGRLVGRDESARSCVERLRGELDSLRLEAQRRLGAAPRPRVLLTTARNPSGLKDILTSARGTIHDELITLAGGQNLFGDIDIPYPQVSLEDIVARAPDVIIELMPEIHVTQELGRVMVEQWREAGPIPACATGRVHILGDEPRYAGSLVPSPRMVELARVFLDLIHPPLATESAPRP
ncbi:MAG: ABC transporter substrate-binding protein [Phycisphaerales bacterium]|nr:ABC transporter substrate-binding protein [Phycisphaerales bacterium]